MKDLRDISLYLLDMDGTIYLGDRVFDCTLPFLAALREQESTIFSLPTTVPATGASTKSG